jgi:dihydroorotate dehydrogenase (fumarate)
MVDLSTTYLGLKLKNPLVASASPLSKKVDNVKRLEDSGVSAVVMYSLFEEQIVHESMELDYHLEHGTESFPEALTYFPDLDYYNLAPQAYLELLHKLKQSVSIPVIGSLNGVSMGGWVHYAKLIEEAGADALELNIYFVPTDPLLGALDLENSYLDLVRQIRSQIHIPLAVKLGSQFSNLPNFTRNLASAGANGLVLFNRFYQPDLDIETMDVLPNLELSTSSELRLPLRWIAILYSRIAVDFALSTGIHTARDIVKAVMAGANVAMSTSALLHNGPEYARTLLSGLNEWMEEYEYSSLNQMRGAMSQKNVADPAAFERANYMKILNSWDPHLP